ncbi:MAG: helix-turn-helix transcriptional regulator [Armatimonadetes bacterium]|nr:helix-turn-helix transcriptional regulator [Armatimonadota bacterium]
MARTIADHIEELRHDPEFVADGLVLDLAEQMLARLEELGLTRAELARRMGVTPAYITKILRGANVSLLTIAKMAVALEAVPKITLEPRGRAFSAARRPWLTAPVKKFVPEVALPPPALRLAEIAA